MAATSLSAKAGSSKASNWRQRAFDASSWSPAKAPVLATTDGAPPATLYLRTSFCLTSASLSRLGRQELELMLHNTSAAEVGPVQATSCRRPRWRCRCLRPGWAGGRLELAPCVQGLQVGWVLTAAHPASGVAQHL